MKAAITRAKARDYILAELDPNVVAGFSPLYSRLHPIFWYSGSPWCDAHPGVFLADVLHEFSQASGVR